MQAAVGKLLDPVETGKMGDVDKPIRRSHAALHQVEKIRAGGKISGAGCGSGGDGGAVNDAQVGIGQCDLHEGALQNMLRGRPEMGRFDC